MSNAMSAATESPDSEIIDLLRRQESVSVSELADIVGVTATAVRQRLARLMGEGRIERRVERTGRGRPSHRYSLTDKGRRAAGSNYADLAMTLWNEIRAIEDPKVRRGLLQRVAEGLAAEYGGHTQGRELSERMQGLVELMQQRDVPWAIDSTGDLPVLTALACPYPELAEQDRSICAMEKMLFSELLGQGVRLTECRLDGANCCTFETN